MSKKPDTFDLKINASGSWANAGNFSIHDYIEVMEHCKNLLLLSENSLAFKSINSSGKFIEKMSSPGGLKRGKRHES